MNYITITQPKTAFFNLEGYFYDETIFVYLSSNNNSLFPYVCSLNLFPTNSGLSLSFPAITGFPYTNYTILNNNYIAISISNLQQGLYDIVIGNNAGYSTLSNKSFLISASA